MAKTIILVADTTIFGRSFTPRGDTTNIRPVFGGIGFVKPDGTPVHKPLQQIVLSQEQQKSFLKILRPLAPQTEGEASDCVFFYRHVVLFYDKQDKLIGQMQICFDCSHVAFYPETECMYFFDNQRMDELKQFFKSNNIPMIEYD